MKLEDIKSEAVLAEFFGTFALTFAVLASLQGGIPLLPGPFAAALTLAVFVLLIGPISGTHLNPAITVGMYTIREIRAVNMISYIAAQLSGALLALVMLSLFQNGEIFQLGSGELMENFWAEFLGAFIFGFGFSAAVHNKLKGTDAAIAVGASLLIGISFASIASNGVLNPAVAMGIGSATWPYILGPIFGAFVGINAFKMLLPPTTVAKKASTKSKSSKKAPRKK